MADMPEQKLQLSLGDVVLDGSLGLPAGARGMVIFAHGSGSSRFSPRNTFVAQVLRQAGIGTLLFDLLTEAEDRDYMRRFDIDLLTERLVQTTRWWLTQPEASGLGVGYFGASTGSAAALRAAAALGAHIAAVVSRGGRPDLAMEELSRVQAPTLLIVGGDDEPVITLNRQAYAALRSEKELSIIPGATHLFAEPGTLDEVARLATLWFQRYLPQARLRAA